MAVQGQRPAQSEWSCGVVDACGEGLADEVAGDAGGRSATSRVVVGDHQVRLGLGGLGVSGVGGATHRAGWEAGDP